MFWKFNSIFDIGLGASLNNLQMENIKFKKKVKLNNNQARKLKNIWIFYRAQSSWYRNRLN